LTSGDSESHRMQSDMWWEVLEVPKDATPEQVRAAYKAKSRVCHPDKGGTADDFTRLQNAYEGATRDPAEPAPQAAPRPPQPAMKAPSVARRTTAELARKATVLNRLENEIQSLKRKRAALDVQLDNAYERYKTMGGGCPPIYASPAALADNE